MPIYNYKCLECEKHIEVLQRISDPAPKCECNEAEMQKELTAPAFTFANGQGTDGGLTMRIPGFSVPSGD